MKKTNSFAALTAIVLLLVMGCKVERDAVKVDGITLDKDMLTLAPGATGKLTATAKPSNADDKTVKWSSSDETVATVSADGTVTAHTEGTATITAQAGDKTAICEIIVKPKFVAVENVTLNVTTLALTPDSTGKLTATVTPDNASDKTVTWLSSDTEIATVSDDGTITTHTKGTVNITAQAGNKTVICEVTVHDHSYSGGKCTICGTRPYLAGGTIDNNGILKSYSGRDTTVIIPEGVTNIGNSAFWQCESLTDVTIPASVTSIGYKAFYACDRLSNVTIADGVMNIGDEAFWGCHNLKTVTIPSSVISIGKNAFWCQSLKTVAIPGSVISIGDNAFSDCDNLTTLTIHSGVTNIGNGTFWKCRSLTNVTIPASVTNIGNNAFWGCDKLTRVSYGGTKAKWDTITKGSFYGLSGKTIIGNDGTTWTAQ